MKDFPRIKTGVVNAGNIPEIAGRLSVFTVPALILFADGKEIMREARMVHMDRFREKLSRIYKGYFG